MRVTNTQVLIVGAGPAGLVAAATLARYGIRSVLVERRSEGPTLPRATAVSTRTMELIRSFGLEEEVRSHEVGVDFLAWEAASLAAAEGVVHRLGFPTRAEAPLVSPTAPAVVPQDALEPVLLRHVQRSGLVDVRTGTEFVALQQDVGGAVATMRDRASGVEWTVRSRFVIAADGAHSAVRAAMGVEMDGPDDLQAVLSVLFEAPLWEVAGERRYGIYFIASPEHPGQVLVPSGGDRWVYGRFLDPAREGRADFPPSRILDLIRAATGVPDLDPRIVQTGTFSFAAQVARRYRDQSTFLIGDAAHRITPRGGTGMNTAIHDAYDLAWKLGWVLRGWTDGPDLLDSYEAERRPVGIRNTARSAQRDDGGAIVGQRLAEDLDGRVPHVWVRPGVSTLDLLGPGMTLLIARRGWRWHTVAARANPAVPLAVHALDERVAAELGIPRDGAFLLRPDGKPAEAWPARAAAAA